MNSKLASFNKNFFKINNVRGKSICHLKLFKNSNIEGKKILKSLNNMSCQSNAYQNILNKKQLSVQKSFLNNQISALQVNPKIQLQMIDISYVPSFKLTSFLKNQLDNINIMFRKKDRIKRLKEQKQQMQEQKSSNQQQQSQNQKQEKPKQPQKQEQKDQKQEQKDQKQLQNNQKQEQNVIQTTQSFSILSKIFHFLKEMYVYNPLTITAFSCTLINLGLWYPKIQDFKKNYTQKLLENYKDDLKLFPEKIEKVKQMSPPDMLPCLGNYAITGGLLGGASSVWYYTILGYIQSRFQQVGPFPLIIYKFLLSEIAFMIVILGSYYNKHSPQESFYMEYIEQFGLINSMLSIFVFQFVPLYMQPMIFSSLALLRQNLYKELNVKHFTLDLDEMIKLDQKEKQAQFYKEGMNPIIKQKQQQLLNQQEEGKAFKDDKEMQEKLLKSLENKIFTMEEKIQYNTA